MNMNEMFNPSKLMERMFKRADNVVWDLQTGNLGVKTKDGEIATFDSKTGTVTINLLAFFSMPIPAYAQNTPIEQVKEGDLVITGNDRPGWVTEIKDKSLVLMRTDGSSGRVTPPKVSLGGAMDQSGVMVVRSLLNMLPGGNTGLAGLQSSLLPMMMLGGDNVDFDDIMPMLLISQMGMPGVAPADPNNPAANPFAGGNLINMMMMMKLMGGGNGGNLFGGKGNGPFKR